ncbi:MAG TPA: sigma-54 dependent transcriptional regulator [Candidatus Sulfotelmatobacter sp.]|nr:sigma-54 dependent transcriptional regulator [Candidatus Sulfotelmatobacter sp.]
MSSAINLKLLAIDDDQHNLDMIRLALDRQGLEILTEQDPERGFELFLQARPKVVLLDLVMPKVTGIELLERIVGVDPGVEVILITAHYSAESAVEAIQKGATDYLTKPIEIDKLRSRVSALMADAEARQKTLQLDQALIDAYQFEGLVGRSPLMLEVYAKIRRIAPHFRTVLVTGATGTGKELVARALHRLSPVGSGPFVVCNCSALVDSLVESELFGYVKGAFTGATQDKIGLFEHADKGTIFLDEIGELAPAAQAKLLRVLQNRQVQRVGSLTPRNIDVRVIAATHRNLKNMVRDGQFREDLYYRLAVVEIPLPILANRREDLPLLERYFIEKFSTEYNKPIAGLVRRAQTRLATYPWPGNVRELENVIGNACMMVEGNLIDIGDLPEKLRKPLNEEISGDDTFLSLEEVQRRHVIRVLEGVGGNKARAAEILGIGRATIYQLLSKMKIEETKKETAAN